MRRVTLNDVARLAKVSPITVSRALRHPESVSEELRLRVHAVVKKLGYVPNLAASRLASSRTQLIGVIVPTLYNVIFADYLLALHEALISEGFQIVVVNSRYSESEEEAAIKTLIGQRVEAIVVAGARHTPLARRILTRSRVPVIETFELAEDPIGLNIGLSQQEAAAAAIASSHRRRSTTHRLLRRQPRRPRRGAARGLSSGDVGSRARGRDRHHPDRARQLDRSWAPALLEKRVEEARPPEAIFCIDDNLALGAMQECRKRRIVIPEDVAIVGFHDLEFAACLSPSLSSVATRRFETGSLAAQKLIEALNGGRPMAANRSTSASSSLRARARRFTRPPYRAPRAPTPPTALPDEAARRR